MDIDEYNDQLNRHDRAYGSKQKMNPKSKKLRSRIFLSSLLVVMAGGAIFATLVFLNGKPVIEKNESEYSSTKVEEDDIQDLTTYIPSGKTVDSLGGLTKTTKEGSNPLYSFSDKIGNVEITVNQQKIPDDSIPVEELLEEMASKDDYSAISVKSDGLKLYVKTGANGLQYVFFHKDDTLIMIVSAAVISNDSWIAYALSFS